jgi:hypothetical protein
MKHLITITIMLAIALCASCDKKDGKGSDDDNNSSNDNPAIVTKKYVVGNFYNENGIQGIIYKLDNDNQHGMIISLDEVTNCGWATDTAVEKVETQATNVENGMENMEKIKALGIDKYPAFKWCESKNKDGITGWYLPGSYELDDIYRVYANTALSFSDSIKTNGGIDFSPTYYWSSSEVSAAFPPVINAQTVNFQNGRMDNTIKSIKHSVRAVRAF